jgi:hypothetical protein
MTENNALEKTMTTDPQPSSQSGPIVLSLKKKKKNKRRYSKGLEEVQRMEPHLTRSTHRLAKAFDKGISTYRKGSIKSARKKKDGAMRDLLPNSARAMSQAFKEVTPIPYDIARAMNTKPSRRRLKRQLRTLSRSLRSWRW